MAKLYDKKEQAAILRSYRTLWNGLQRTKKLAQKNKDFKLESIIDKALIKAELQLYVVRNNVY